MTNISKLIVEYSGPKTRDQDFYYDTLNRIFPLSYQTSSGPTFALSFGPTDEHLRFGPPRGIENRISWTPCDRTGSTFTDPKTFDPNKFQFIVHVIGAGAPHLISNANEEFCHRLLSCSIINPIKTTTFIFDFGFILKVPESNIYATTPCDMFLSNREIEKDKDKSKPERLDKELTRVNTTFGISTPKEILESSHPKKINEIAVLGKGVTVIGVFRKVLKTTEKTRGSLFPHYERYAEKHKVPIVDIPISYMTAKQKLKKKEAKALSIPKKTETEQVKQDSSKFSSKRKKNHKSKQTQFEQQQPMQKKGMKSK